MRLFCLAVQFVLITVIIDVFSICPESGCGCNEHCVNGDNIWCSNNNDEDCSCKKGCFVLDTLLEHGEHKEVHCNICNCDTDSTSAGCTRKEWCLPKGFTVGVHYPDDRKKNPNCGGR